MILPVVIAGCSASPVYVKDNLAYASYEKDLEFCRNESKDIGAPHRPGPYVYTPRTGSLLVGFVQGAISGAAKGIRDGKAANEMQRAWIKGCMKEKGYVEILMNEKDQAAFNESKDPTARIEILRRINEKIKAGTYNVKKCSN
tara:strand:- start:8416 stop:8844 length:429 start_codon:yes stop_codon:yes gene_type:complete